MIGYDLDRDLRRLADVDGMAANALHKTAASLHGPSVPAPFTDAIGWALDGRALLARFSSRTVQPAESRSSVSYEHCRLLNKRKSTFSRRQGSLSPHLLLWKHELAFDTWRLLGKRRFIDAGDFDLIQTIMHIGCGNQVAHRGFQRLVPHPVLNSSYVEILTQHPCRISGSKCLQIEPAGSRPARFATPLQRRSIFSSRLPAGEGNIRTLPFVPGRRSSIVVILKSDGGIFM
jgi:hypothetical protein